MKIEVCRMNRLKNIALIIMGALLFLMLNFRAFSLTGNLSPSEPRGFYRLTRRPITRGAFVQLKAPLKKVAAVPGDTVRVTADGVYINGKRWPDSAIPTDSTFVHYPFGTYTVQTGQLWLLGENPLSFDSRWFGPVPAVLVNSTVQPLLTK
jgi:type IV secretory pathway protease TraF